MPTSLTILGSVPLMGEDADLTTVLTAISRTDEVFIGSRDARTMIHGARGTAIAGPTNYDSYDAEFKTSVWDSTVAATRKMSLRAKVTSTTVYRLTVLDNGGTEVASVAQDGTILSSGNLEFKSGTAYKVILDHAATADRTITIPDASLTVVGVDTTQALTGKTYNALTLTAVAVGFTIAGGTTSKTLTVALDASVSGTNTGDQTITLSGDVSGSGTGAITATIGANKVTLGMMAQMATASLLGRNTAGTGDVEVLSAATVKTLIGLGSVENTALSTWAGTTNITTLGTITAGTWTGTAIAVANGGTGLTAGTSGGVLAYSATGTIVSSALLTANALVLGGGAGVAPSALGSLGTTTTLLHGNAAGAPTFAAVSLTADVSGILPTANGGTGIAYFTAAGPSVARVYTFPDAACSVLTTNAAVSVAQGGTGATTAAGAATALGLGTGNSPTFTGLTLSGTSLSVGGPSGSFGQLSSITGNSAGATTTALLLQNKATQAVDVGVALRFGGASDWLGGIDAVFNASLGGYLKFSTQTGGALYERVRIDAAGNIGHGVTPKTTWPAGDVAFHIADRGVIMSGSSDATNYYHMFMQNAYLNSGWKRIVAGYAAQYYQFDGTHVWSVAGTSTADSAIIWTTAAQIDNAGVTSLLSGRVVTSGEWAAAQRGIEITPAAITGTHAIRGWSSTGVIRLVGAYTGDGLDKAYVEVDGSFSKVNLSVGGTKRIEADSTGLGFFAATPAAKPTISGAKGSNAALGSLLTALATLGLITDSTTA